MALRESEIDIGAQRLLMGESVRRWTVAEYNRLSQAKVLANDERTELIEGIIHVMSPMGPTHASTLFTVWKLLQDAYGAAQYVPSQVPVILSDLSEPEPDIIVARGSVRDYFNRPPSSPDILLIVEISDSSLQFDKNLKSVIYGRSGIPEYWVVDLYQHEIIVFKDPDTAAGYRSSAVISPGSTISPSFSPPVNFELTSFFQ
jgi:Uma2 family endonuclease